MRFYTIDGNFLKYLKSLEPKIHENYGNPRPYIGILLSINGFDYYAPLSSYKAKQDSIKNITVFKLHEKGNLENKLGVIHLNNMCPVPISQLTEVVIDFNTKYGRLLQNQYEYILHYQDNIQKQAERLYASVREGKSFLKDLSCDFQMLEEAVQNWNQK